MAPNVMPGSVGLHGKWVFLTNLLYLVDDIAQILDECNQMDVCYFRFNQGFDLVNRPLFLTDLWSSDIRGQVNQKVKAFLTGRNFHSGQEIFPPPR